jgi:hypothetical protein
VQISPSPQGEDKVQRLSLAGKSAKKISSPCSEIFTEVTDEVSLTRILPLRSENGAFHLIRHGIAATPSPQGEG